MKPTAVKAKNKNRELQFPATITSFFVVYCLLRGSASGVLNL